MEELGSYCPENLKVRILELEGEKRLKEEEMKATKAKLQKELFELEVRLKQGNNQISQLYEKASKLMILDQDSKAFEGRVRSLEEKAALEPTKDTFLAKVDMLVEVISSLAGSNNP